MSIAFSVSGLSECGNLAGITVAHMGRLFLHIARSLVENPDLFSCLIKPANNFGHLPWKQIV